MSATPTSPPSAPSTPSGFSTAFRRILRILGVVILLLLLPSALPPLAHAILLHLPLGWIGFLRRVLPQVTFSGSAVWLGVICSVLIVVGVQWLATGFCRPGPGRPPRSWRWRWTWSLGLYGLLWCLFLATMGVTGVAHQVAWLVQSREPLYVVRPYRGEAAAILREQSGEIAMAGVESAWDAAATRAAWLAGQRPRANRGPQGNDPLENLQAQFIADPGGRLIAAFLSHRDPARRHEAGFVEITPDSVSEARPASEFPAALAAATRKATPR